MRLLITLILFAVLPQAATAQISMEAKRLPGFNRVVDGGGQEWMYRKFENWSVYARPTGSGSWSNPPLAVIAADSFEAVDSLAALDGGLPARQLGERISYGAVLPEQPDEIGFTTSGSAVATESPPPPLHAIEDCRNPDSCPDHSQDPEADRLLRRKAEGVSPVLILAGAGVFVFGVVFAAIAGFVIYKIAT